MACIFMSCHTLHRNIPVVCIKCGRMIKHVKVCSHIVGNVLYSSCDVYNMEHATK
ncbi:MAG: hypothetical protein QXV23_04980 [Candidatus Bathyarchaeia archaeon]